MRIQIIYNGQEWEIYKDAEQISSTTTHKILSSCYAGTIENVEDILNDLREDEIK